MNWGTGTLNAKIQVKRTNKTISTLGTTTLENGEILYLSNPIANSNLNFLMIGDGNNNHNASNYKVITLLKQEIAGKITFYDECSNPVSSTELNSLTDATPVRLTKDDGTTIITPIIPLSNVKYNDNGTWKTGEDITGNINIINGNITTINGNITTINNKLNSLEDLNNYIWEGYKYANVLADRAATDNDIITTKCNIKRAFPWDTNSSPGPAELIIAASPSIILDANGVFTLKTNATGYVNQTFNRGSGDIASIGQFINNNKGKYFYFRSKRGETLYDGYIICKILNNSTITTDTSHQNLLFITFENIELVQYNYYKYGDQFDADVSASHTPQFDFTGYTTPDYLNENIESLNKINKNLCRCEQGSFIVSYPHTYDDEEQKFLYGNNYSNANKFSLKLDFIPKIIYIYSVDESNNVVKNVFDIIRSDKVSFTNTSSTYTSPTYTFYSSEKGSISYTYVNNIFTLNYEYTGIHAELESTSFVNNNTTYASFDNPEKFISTYNEKGLYTFKPSANNNYTMNLTFTQEVSGTQVTQTGIYLKDLGINVFSYGNNWTPVTTDTIEIRVTSTFPGFDKPNISYLYPSIPTPSGPYVDYKENMKRYNYIAIG